jgi:phosphate transport system substrate-binding protein
VRTPLRRPARTLAPLLALALIAGACGDDGNDDAAVAADGSGQAEAAAASESPSGTIDVSGSSTVAPVTTRVAERYEAVAPGAQVNVDGPGTGDGFVLFCDGETDISDASRPIKGEEAEACEANGVEYLELKIAVDGLSVLVNPANDVECLSFEDMYALVGPESQGIGDWSDAEELAAELGSETSFPELSLDVVAPGEESGTYDSVVELVLADLAEERDEEPESRPDYQSSEDDNVIIQGIQGSSGSFGWVGYAFAVEAGDSVKQVEVSEEPDGDCVAPTDETVSDGSYPLARDLYIYVNADRLETDPALDQFVEFFLSDDGMTAVSEVGYVDLDDEALEETRRVWADRRTGTRDGG